MIDHYKILQVTRNASQEVIQAAFLARTQSIQKDYADDAKKLHVLSIVLLNAYNTLSDPEKRRQLDTQLLIEETKQKIISSTKNETTPLAHHRNTEIRIEPSFQPNKTESEITTINTPGGSRKFKSNKLRIAVLLIVLLAFFSYNYSSKIKESDAFKVLSKAINGDDETKQTSANNKNQIKETGKSIKTTEKQKPTKVGEYTENNHSKQKKYPESQMEAGRASKQSSDTGEEQRRLNEIQAKNLKLEQERARALEIEHNQIIAAQKLRCDKAKLHYANSQNRINSVKSSYQNKLNDIENEIQGTAFASIVLAFKDKRALSEGANMNRPKEELKKQVQTRMNDEISILETELEQFRISNLECFR